MNSLLGTMDHDSSSRLDRRSLLKSAAATGVFSAVGAGARAISEPRSSASNMIPKENELPGTTDWQLTYTRVDPETLYRCPWIEGFVSRTSIRSGETLDLFVSTNPPAPFKVDIYRMGYYGGKGARHLLSLGPYDGEIQSDPEIGEKRLRECRWKKTASIHIPDDWKSGVYLGKISLLEGRFQSYVVFIVRDDRPADVIFQCSDNTWQAYNRWPDHYSLYDDGKRQWALGDDALVSFDRPYGKYCQIVDAPLSQGSGEFLLWEFPLAYWLEREGFDVTYVSNVDVHSDLETITRGKAFLSVGHDEYWSLDQFNHVKRAVGEGVNVAFLSGNTCCFVSPYTPSSSGTPHRIIRRQGRYGGLLEREKKIMGPFQMEGPNESSLIGARTISPFNGAGDWIVSQEESWIFEGTGLKNGDRIPGLVGWEHHGDPADIPGLEVVAEGKAINTGDTFAHWTATLYPGPKDNWVFNASTIFWSQGLASPPGHILPYSHYTRPHGPDPRVEKITRNLFERFIS